MYIGGTDARASIIWRRGIDNSMDEAVRPCERIEVTLETGNV